MPLTTNIHNIVKKNTRISGRKLCHQQEEKFYGNGDKGEGHMTRPRYMTIHGIVAKLVLVAGHSHCHLIHSTFCSHTQPCSVSENDVAVSDNRKWLPHIFIIDHRQADQRSITRPVMQLWCFQVLSYKFKYFSQRLQQCLFLLTTPYVQLITCKMLAVV